MNCARSVLLLLLAGTPAPAHDEKVSTSRVEVKQDGIVWVVDVALQGLEKVMKLPVDPLDLTERQLQGMRGEIVAYLQRCLRVEIDGTAATAEAGILEPLYETFVATGEKYIAHARQEFRFRSSGPVKRVRLSAALFVTVTDRHQATLHVSWNGARRSYSRVGPFELEITLSRLQPTFWSTSSEFLILGLRTILTGARTLAFLLALLLGARMPGELIRGAASFAVAHSLTLLLATLEVIRLPAAVTESLIALSIVYVAAENFFIKDARHRWVLIFAFGLVHGLGFSSVICEQLQDIGAVALPIVSFNLGVELGLIAILLVAFPALAWIRKASDETAAARRHCLLARIGSTPVLLLGLAWFVDRVSPVKWMPF